MTDSTYLEPLLDVLRDLVAWMKDQNVPGAVIGGVAAGLLGRPRVTGDVDYELFSCTGRLCALLSRAIHLCQPFARSILQAQVSSGASPAR